jgi:hypothetical protein
MRTRSMITALLLTTTVVFLSACDLTGEPTPSSVQLNGYVVERDATGEPTGKVEFGASAFDSQDEIISDAKIESVSAEITSVSTAGGASLGTAQSYSVAGSVCGDVTAKPGPVVAVLMLDETGSMGNSDAANDRFVAAKRYVNEMGDSDLAAIARFSSSVTTTSGLINAELMQAFTSDKAALRQAIDDALLARGTTPLWDAAYDMVTLLEPRSEANRVGILLTDGGNTGSSKTPTEANQFAKDEGVALYALGFGGAVPAELDVMVAGTGGYRDLVPEDAGDGQAVENLLDNIFTATQAQGCVALTFAPIPTSGTRLQGNLTIQFDRGGATSPFDVTF